MEVNTDQGQDKKQRDVTYMEVDISFRLFPFHLDFFCEVIFDVILAVSTQLG